MRKLLAILGSAATVAAFGMPAAYAGTGGEPVQAGAVLASPPPNLPHLPATTNQTEQIRQLAECGNTMYAVGSFTTIRRWSATYTRDNIFSFSATAPYQVTSWAPDVVGTYGTTSNPSDVLNTIAFVGGDCSHAYIGGHFSSVDGTAVKDIAEISTTTGKVVTSFESHASGAVETIVAAGDHLLVGGRFTGINGDTTDPYLASLNPATGKSDGFLHLAIHGNYQFSGASSNATHVYNQQLSPDGKLDLVEGDFTSAGGQSRQQAFIMNVSGKTATVTGWDATEFATNCDQSEPFYVQDGAWSPDGSTVYFGTTGYHPDGGPIGNTTRTGPCDAALAFPSSSAAVSALWTNYTGCDSLYAAAADSHAVYFAGHERWSMNSDGCDSEGTGAYPAAGLEGLDPASGALYLNSGGTEGYYSRDRGLGADDMLATSAGLWIASDNFDHAQYCGGVSVSGLCLLPYQ